MSDDVSKAGKVAYRGKLMSRAQRRTMAIEGKGHKWGRISGRNHIKKSLAALGEAVAIVKAKMRFADGSIRNVSRAQRRAIRYQNAKDGELRAGTRVMLKPGVFNDSVRRNSHAGPDRPAHRPPSDKLSALRNRKGRQFMYGSGDRTRQLRPNAFHKAIKKAKPKTLYVYRPVENAADIIAWAKSQGFATTLAPEDLHVTLAHSKTPLNWAMLHDDYHLEPDEGLSACGCAPVCRADGGGAKTRRIKGGVREVKALGAEGAIVLAFESDTLTRRWMDFKGAGAVWSFPSFVAHVTLTYSGKGVDLSRVHAYAGDIVLGEECWEEIEEGAQEAAIAREAAGGVLDTLEVRLAAVEAAAKKEAA